MINYIIKKSLFFSYWIFLWFILYLLKVTSYNPKFIFSLCVLIISIVIICTSIYLQCYELDKQKKYNLIRFEIVTLIIKSMPFFYLINTQITQGDIDVSIVVIIIYLIWLYINNTNVFDTYKKLLIRNIDNPKATVLMPQFVFDSYDYIYNLFM
jgi:hypothetical protein